MSESSVSAQSSLASTAALNPGGRVYQLSDDLARLSLPQEFRDEYRRLAWANSICALFLLVGIIGLNPPKIVQRPLSAPMEQMQAVLVQPEEQPKPQQQTQEEKPEETQETPEAPEVVTVVAPADAKVAFAVPVQGAVMVAPAAHLASAPPRVQAPPRPVQFNPNASGEAGTFPKPRYPGEALRNRYQGTVQVEIKVDTSGAITSAKVTKSSGFPVLDEAALEVVKNRWRFLPGTERWLQWPCVFRLE
jgi:periplasmic protein TonB